LDLFVTEDVEYALKHVKAGVPTELHVRPGVPHAWDMISPKAEVTRKAFEDRCRTVRTIGAGT
jgi:acetyl esterase/lipase